MFGKRPTSSFELSNNKAERQAPVGEETFAGGGAPLKHFVEVGNPALVEPLQDFVNRLVDSGSVFAKEQSERHIEALIPFFLEHAPAPNARRMLEIDNAKLRADFVANQPTFTAADLSTMAGHVSKNRSVTASRWKGAGRVFSVPYQGSELYPAFQFDDGEPKPAIATILARLPQAMSAWQRAFWFTSPNGWLDGATPAEKLADVEAVSLAAERLADPVG